MKTDSTLTLVQRAVALMELEQFKAVDSEELANIAGKMLEQRFEAGEIIATQAEPVDRLFLVLEGEVALLRDGVVVRRATRGMGFGLYGLLGVDEQDGEQIQAMTPTHTIALTRDDFLEGVVDHPGFAIGVIQGLGRTILHFAKRVESLEKQLLAVSPVRETPS